MSIRPKDSKAAYYAQGRTVYHRPDSGMAFKLFTVGEFADAPGESDRSVAEILAAELDEYPALKAKAEELDKIAETLGEGEDPFAAWESLALIIREHRKMREYITEAGSNDNVNGWQEFIADISELKEPVL
ncbi:hypothetical protein JessAGP_013 [Caulobacter phage Jess A]|nr:hypothetical protein JessAGP_013 [Caulobacter phage Jess A]WCA46422.1 hypothetical protein [Caulobacter phage RapA]